MKIIDSHHHVWLKKDLPWLTGPNQPRIFGAYDQIKRDYLIEEFLSDTCNLNIEKSIYVQTNWDTTKFEDEVIWVEKISATNDGLPNAIVCFCDLRQTDVRNDLDKLKKYNLIRGIRQQIHWHKNKAYRFSDKKSVPLEKNFRKNIGYLKDYNLSFDLQIFPNQFATSLSLIDEFYEVQFILEHAGMLEDTSKNGKIFWEDNMRELAKRKNVAVKISALGTFIRRNSTEHITWILNKTVDIFGIDRCMFGSNFPIEKLWTTYAELLKSYFISTSKWSKKSKENFFYNNAVRYYKL